MIGSLGMGPVGYPSSSTSGRMGPSTNSGPGNFSGEVSRIAQLPSSDALRRRIGGGIASSSLFEDSGSGEASRSGGSSECARQKWKKLKDD